MHQTHIWRRLFLRAVMPTVTAIVLTSSPTGGALGAGPEQIRFQDDPWVISNSCAFPVLVEPAKQRTTVKIWTFDDGSATLIVSGQYNVTLTNLETGQSIALVISGPAFLDLAPDGSLVSFTGNGHGLVWNSGVDPGIFLAAGHFQWPGGPVTIAEFAANFRGRMVDLCPALS